MAQKISLMTAISAGNLDDTALFETVDKNGATRKSTLAQLRTALLTAALFTTSLASAAGFISLGTTPTASGAIRIDSSSYSDVAISVNRSASSVTSVWRTSAGATSFGVTSNDSLILIANNTTKWSIAPTASTSSLASGEVTARIIGGSTNGLAIRNSANTLNNFTVADVGGMVTIGIGSAAITASNPILSTSQTWNSAGVTFVGQTHSIVNTASAAGSLIWALYSGAAGTSLQASMNASGSSFAIPNANLNLGGSILSTTALFAIYTSANNAAGGTVLYNGGGGEAYFKANAAAHSTLPNVAEIGGGNAASARFDGSATATYTRMSLYIVDTATFQRVQTISNAAITTMLGFAGRLLYVAL